MRIGAIDIGGTAIKFAIADELGALTDWMSVPTEAYKGGEHILTSVLHICDNWLAQYPLDGIAISTAGQVDPVRGEITYATETIPGYTGMQVVDRVSAHTRMPVSIENDVNCTALGEQWLGATKGMDNFLTVTLGTGIGGALFLNGELYRGVNFGGGEIGHMNLHPNGRQCTCGQNGCYERYASSAALTSLIQTELGTVDMPFFFELVRSENPVAKSLFLMWIDELTTGLASLVHIFNPSTILIGGGVSAQGEFLLHAIREALSTKLIPSHRIQLSVKLAEKGNDANLLGAIRHFLNQHVGSQ